MIDTLVHTFTKRLSKPENLTRIVWLYEQTAKQSRNFYKTKLITDVDSVSLFDKNNYDEIITIEIDSVHLLDDMKLSALKYLNSNELLIDGDIYLREKLNLEKSFDILCESGSDRRFSPTFSKTIDTYLNLRIQKKIPFFDDSIYIVPNIGILYFKSRELQVEYLNWYEIFRQWVIKNRLVEFFYSSRRQITMPNGQYLLGVFAKNYQIDIKYTKGLSDYTHYQLDIKYTENFKIER